MARRSRADEIAELTAPLAMDMLACLQEIGVNLAPRQAIAFLERFEKSAARLAAEGASLEVRNGASTH